MSSTPPVQCVYIRIPPHQSEQGGARVLGVFLTSIKWLYDRKNVIIVPASEDLLNFLVSSHSDPTYRIRAGVLLDSPAYTMEEIVHTIEEFVVDGMRSFPHKVNLTLHFGKYVTPWMRYRHAMDNPSLN